MLNIWENSRKMCRMSVTIHCELGDFLNFMFMIFFRNNDPFTPFNSGEFGLQVVKTETNYQFA